MTYQPTRWSYSAINTWRTCPRQYYYSYILRTEWVPSAAMSRGTRMHLMAEEFVKGVTDSVPFEIQKVGPLLQQLKNYGAKAEEVWLLDRDWKPVENQDQAWIKAIIDVHYVQGDILYVKDYKSGQMYDDHLKQLELYGLIGLCKFPDVKRVNTSAVYMDIPHEGNEGTIIRAMIPGLIKPWDDDAKTMMADKEWVARPSNFNCRRCSYNPANGGECEFAAA